MVYPTHQEYRCLGCPAHGNVIKFIIEIEKTKLDDAMKKMKPSGTAVRFLEDLITERLGSMGYTKIQHVHVDLSQKWLVYQAIVPAEMIERLSSAYFAVEQLAEVTDLSKQGVIEFLVLPDHRSTLTLDGNPVKFKKLKREQRPVINDLQQLLENKINIDFRYVLRELRK